MTTKVFDTFDGPANDDIDTHAPNIDVVGGGWIDSGANAVELDGSGAIEFNNANDACWIDVGATDQWAVVNITAGGSANRFHVTLRRDSASSGSENGYRFNFRPDANSLFLYETSNGSATEIASKTTGLSFLTSATYSLEPEINGSALDFIIDGISELSVTDTTHTTGGYAGTRHALYSDNNLRVYDFQIDDAAPVVGGINVFRRRMIIRKSA